MRIALALAAAGLFIWVNRDWALYSRLDRAGVAVDGRVIGKDDGPPQKIHYSFQGPVKIHTAIGEAGYGNPEYAELKVGDPLIVYFLPPQPDVSMAGLPTLRLRYRHRALVYMLLVLGPALFWVARRELRGQSA